MYVKKLWCEPNPSTFGKVIGYLRRVRISGQFMRNKINQHSIIFRQKLPDPIEVSDAVFFSRTRLHVIKKEQRKAYKRYPDKMPG
jgi:hypothetical protein